MKRSRTRIVLMAVLAVLALSALLPATAGATTHKLGTGTAAFNLDPAETKLFIANALIVPYPILPAGISFSASHVKFTMPIAGGTWTPGTGAHGTFLLRGGLAYVSPGSTFVILNLKGWRAGVNNSTGFSISANGTRSPNFFDENLMGSIPSVVTIHGHRYAKVTDVLLFFNATSAGAINGAFSTAPAPGDPFGSVTFLARLK